MKTAERIILGIWLANLFLLVLLAGYFALSPSLHPGTAKAATVTPTPFQVPTFTATDTATATDTSTPTQTFTITASATLTATLTTTPLPTSTASLTSTANATATQTQDAFIFRIQSSGATAICRDGTLSYSRNRRGTCSHHGGVRTWLR
ncbi:MAG: DUF3761 domain-containing protein [Anaerolineales bacterium]|nr:DUF3761 domain-containing protein [Anaerolineales bacterium]MBX3004725.1 DUF3761 domain-containing protein [Anaerolineales bacterium]